MGFWDFAKTDSKVDYNKILPLFLMLNSAANPYAESGITGYMNAAQQRQQTEREDAWNKWKKDLEERKMKMAQQEMDYNWIDVPAESDSNSSAPRSFMPNGGGNAAISAPSWQDQFQMPKADMSWLNMEENPNGENSIFKGKKLPLNFGSGAESNNAQSGASSQPPRKMRRDEYNTMVAKQKEAEQKKQFYQNLYNNLPPVGGDGGDQYAQARKMLGMMVENPEMFDPSSAFSYYNKATTPTEKFSYDPSLYKGKYGQSNVAGQMLLDPSNFGGRDEVMKAVQEANDWESGEKNRGLDWFKANKDGGRNGPGNKKDPLLIGYQDLAVFRGNSKEKDALAQRYSQAIRANIGDQALAQQYIDRYNYLTF